MRFRLRRRYLTAVSVAVVAAFWLGAGQGALPTREVLATRLGALGPAALPVSALLWAGASLLGTPGSLLVGTSVWLFGFGAGAGVSAAGAVLSAGGAFWIARRLGRERLLDWVAERHLWRRLDEEVGRYGGWIVLLLRLLPSLPFTVLNYLLGLTGVRFGTYLLATTVGLLPNLLIFAYAARQLLLPVSGGAPWERPGFWWAMALVALFLVGGPVAIRVAERRGHGGWLAPLARIQRGFGRCGDQEIE